MYLLVIHVYLRYNNTLNFPALKQLLIIGALAVLKNSTPYKLPLIYQNKFDITQKQIYCVYVVFFRYFYYRLE